MNGKVECPRCNHMVDTLIHRNESWWCYPCWLRYTSKPRNHRW